jgi:hypothetical protein
MAKKIFRVAGDTGPNVEFQLEGINVAGYSAIMHVRRAGGDLISRAGGVISAPIGLFGFAFVAGDLIEGDHSVEFQVTNTGGQVITYPANAPITLVVRDEED